MSMRLKAIIFLVVGLVILYLPFAVHAASGNIFKGLPIPVLGGSGASEEPSSAVAQTSSTESQYSGQAYLNGAAVEQYAESLPKPAVASASIDINYMRNHMILLKQEGQSTKQCATCHANRAEFCDRCHNFVGVSPKIDY